MEKVGIGSPQFMTHEGKSKIPRKTMIMPAKKPQICMHAKKQNVNTPVKTKTKKPRIREAQGVYKM